jgi:hypothetical protein
VPEAGAVKPESVAVADAPPPPEPIESRPSYRATHLIGFPGTLKATASAQPP